MGRIISKGVVNPNRTGIDTRVLLNKKLKFELMRDGMPTIPLLTSKTCLLKNICVELASFLRADDNTDFMRERGCNIWDGNSTREFLDSRGLRDYAPGQLGPIYGCQWRRWNADWNPTDGFTSSGFDHIADLIKRAREKPECRRLIVSAWNPTKVSQMALPPCHMFFQINILGSGGAFSDGKTTPGVDDKRLHLTFYMRSADIALGVPYNIASYAILAHLLAREIGVKPGTVTCIMANCHIYENHVELAREQVNRLTYAFPTLDMKSNTIEEFIAMPYADNIRVDNYVHGAFIPYPMN
jgi:thymidylate synthase